MTNLYLPVDDVSHFQCYVVADKDTIRAYYQKPNSEGSYNYVDFYINSHYLEKTGTQVFNHYSTYPSCIDSSIITNDYHYRFDYISILFLVFSILFVCVYIPYKFVLKNLFGKWC